MENNLYWRKANTWRSNKKRKIF